MKAEHRKELETNVLADRMGKFIQGARQGPSRNLVYWVLGGLALLVIVFFVSRWRTTRAEQAALMWVMMEDGSPQYLEKIAKDAAGKNSGKSAQFQLAWEDLWTKGIKMLGAPNNFKLAMSNIDLAEQRYKKLAETCKNDPVFYPEALYALAVIEETRALENKDSLTASIDKYKEVVRAGKESAFGRLASARLEVLEDEIKFREMQRFYQDLQHFLKPPLDLPPLPGLGGGKDTDFAPKLKGLGGILDLPLDRPAPELKKEPETKQTPEANKSDEKKEEKK